MGTFAPCAGAGPGPVHELAIACSVAPRLHDRNAHRGQNPATPPIARRATIMTATHTELATATVAVMSDGEATSRRLAALARTISPTTVGVRRSHPPRIDGCPPPGRRRVRPGTHREFSGSAAQRLSGSAANRTRCCAARSSSRHNPRSRITLSQHTALDVPGRTGRRASLTNHSEWRTSGERRPRPPAGAVLGMLRTLLSATLRRRGPRVSR